MYLFLLSSLAFSGELHIDARIPTAVYIDGQAFVELSQPGTAQFDIANGEHKLVIMTNGNPSERMVTIGDTPAQLLVGRSGISIGEAEVVVRAQAETGLSSTLELRSTSKLPLMVYIGQEKHVLPAKATKVLEVKAGQHSISVRNDSGTAIFASGAIVTDGEHRVIMQLSEGRVPEISGEGSQYLPSSP
jgi:hypothetical protein